MESKRTGVFNDEECTCKCGNKHELYGGKGYTTTALDGYSNGKVDGGYYYHAVKCNVCNELSELSFYSN